MKVRLGLWSDIDALVELARLNAADSCPYLTFNEDRVRATYQRYLATANPTFFFAVDDSGRTVGFLEATMQDYEFAVGFFTTQQVIFVHPDKRGTRAAALLVDMFTRWSDALGALENTGGNDNDLTSDRTARFLGRFGFQRVGYFVRRMQGARGKKERR